MDDKQKFDRLVLGLIIAGGIALLILVVLDQVERGSNSQTANTNSLYSQ
jgi:hypothetical protein